MKNLCIAALAIAALLGTTHFAPAQSAFFTYTNVPTSPLAPGSTFTIGVTLNFTAGGAATSVGGLSYWMYQQSPTSTFPFSITNRNVTGSQFIDLLSPFPAYPEKLQAINPSDLGALGDPNATNGSGSYFISNLTFSLDTDAVPGIYTISNTTAATPGGGNFISSISDQDGTSYPMGASAFTVTVVPEPSTYALLVFGAVAAAGFVYRRRRRILF